MEVTPSSGEVYSAHKVVEQPPFAESFYDARYIAKMWPEVVARDPGFIAQIQSRAEISRHIAGTVDSLPGPTTTIEDGIEQGYLTDLQAAQLYEYLGSLVNDEDYQRLILYLPFELLPDSTWEPNDERLKLAVKGFTESYVKAWSNLLNVHDVRANFIDGDVLEVEQRISDLPRVVKAAHLIPELVEKGILDTQEIFNLIRNYEDPVLVGSILDTVGLLLGKKLITNEQAAVMRECGHYSSAGETAARATAEPTEKRIAWLRYQEAQKAIAESANEISESILAGSLPAESFADALSAEADNQTIQIIITAVQNAIESMAANDYEAALKLYDEFKETLVALIQTPSQEIKDLLFKTFRRLHRLGIVPLEQLETLGVQLPTLSGKLSENLKLIPGEIENIKQICASIEANTELAAIIYPVVLVYGSRLKGYGEQSADVDLAVFVKPGTREEDRPRLRELINETFYKSGKPEIVTEFWLGEKNDGFEVLNCEVYDPLQAEKHWSHVLFGASWIGREDAVTEMQRKVLLPYLHDNGEQIYGHDARSLYLEELERDILQYRLVQKGYERHYPTNSTDAAHANSADKQSTFWDPGFRRLATKLFVDKVFLPKIK